MSQLRTSWTAPPTHIRVYPCPQCQETISVDAPSCRFCHVPIDVKVAEQRWAENQQIATAISRGMTFSLTSHMAVVTTGIALWFLYFLGRVSEFWIIAPLLAVSYGAQWLSHNRSLAPDDADYLAAVAKVKRTMLVWAVSLLVQVAVYLILDGLPDLATILEPLLVDSLSERS